MSIQPRGIQISLFEDSRYNVSGSRFQQTKEKFTKNHKINFNNYFRVFRIENGEIDYEACT